MGLGACALPEVESFRAPDATNLFRRTSVAGFRERTLAPVTANDLVDNNGICSGGAPSAPGGDAPGGEPAIPAIPSTVGLEMTECEVVRRAGAPDRVEVSGNSVPGRTVTMTYGRGDRPGLYRFNDGRLRSLEAVAEAAPAKPAKKVAKQPAKPARSAAQPRGAIQ